MRTWKILYTAGTRLCLRCITSFLLWGLWLMLGLLFVLQLWIAASHELVLPGPLLRIVEKEMSHPGVTIKLGKVVLDPSGQLVIRDFAVILDSFKEPIVRGSLLHTRIDPWGLLVGDPNARQLELSGVDVLLPAPISPSGVTEAYVRELDAVLYFQGREMEIGKLTALCGNIALSIHGTIQMDAWRRANSDPQGLTWESALGNIISTMRQFSKVYPKLNFVQGARVSLDLTPSESRGAIAEVMITADNLRLPPPNESEADQIRLSGRFPIAGESPAMTRIQASVQSLVTPEFSAQAVQANVRGMLRPALFSFEPREADVAGAIVESHGVKIIAPNARLETNPLPGLRFSLSAGLEDVIVDATGTVDTSTRSGNLHIATTPTNRLMKFVSEQIKHDITRYVQFFGIAHIESDVELSAGGKLHMARGWLEADRFEIQGVPQDHVKGNLAWDGRQFEGTKAVMRQGGNIARGSYTMDAKTRDYRFLLAGHMRPNDINGWFRTGWWPALWKNFDFETAPAEADIDITGRWYSPEVSKVFVGADSIKPSIRTVAFEKVNTQLYVLNNFVHALNFHVLRPEGEAQGWFRRSYDPTAASWRTIEFDVHSTIDTTQGAKIFAPMGPELVEPFVFAIPPKLHAWGHLHGPATPGGASHSVDIDIDSKGEFQLQGFPLEDLKCSVSWEDKDLVIKNARASFAQGTAEAVISIKGKEGSERRLNFNGSLTEARLADVIRISEAYATKKKGGSTTPKPSVLDKPLDARVDISLNAEGVYGDPLSMHGSGQAQLSGGELGQVRLLGLLSELLRFTTLRFTSASTHFTLDGKQITFPSLRIKGKNSAIDAHGRYLLDSKTLDFNAKVSPFEESQNPLQGVLGLLMAPLTHVLEVKLEGTLANPSWSFAKNPFRVRVNPKEDGPAKPDDQAPLIPPQAEPPQQPTLSPESAGKSQDKD